MKKRPSLTLREPVKLYDSTPKIEPEINQDSLETTENNKETKENTNFELGKNPKILEQESRFETELEQKNSLREKMSPRVQQIWDFFSKKAKEENELKRSFSLTRAEVMKEAGIGSTNTYRDALKKFRELNLMEIELRPGVNSGSIFTLTEKGIEEL